MKNFPKYDVIVCGGGVAGVAAAVSARRAGSSVLLLEKTTLLGGLATIGIINFFVPMCNGKGKQVIKGMAEELLRLSVSHGFDSLPPEWKDGEPKTPTTRHYTTDFSAQIFALDLLDLIVREGVDIRFDALVAGAHVENGRITAIDIEDKSGRRTVEASVFIDTTGDSDLCCRAGAPVEAGLNYFSYFGRKVTLESCARAVAEKNIAKVYESCAGGIASLWGDNQPKDRRLYVGGDPDDVSEYLVENQLLLLDKIKGDERTSREIVTLPTMPQTRTTRHLVGDYTFSTDDKFVHHVDSVGAIPDFSAPNDLYEVPYRTMVNKGFPNLIAAGRCASAKGYGWDILRVIPPAILTGQAAGIAAAQSVKRNIDATAVDVPALQEALAEAGIIIHFNEELTAPIPTEKKASETKADDSSHLTAE